MVINTRGMVKISEKLTTYIIPKIITNDIQIKYSEFGRETSATLFYDRYLVETNGLKKFNSSETNTYKYLLGKLN